MAQLNVKLSDDQAEALRRWSARRRTPVSWIIKDYICYLLSGGEPVRAPDPDRPSGQEVAALAQHGGAFDWLAEEPEIYSLEDGKPV